MLYGQPIVPPSQKRKVLPKALDTVLATALAPKPDDRYQDAVAFAEALRQVAHRHGLLFSAPQLAEHLRHILGRNPEQWLSDDKAGPTGDPSTQKIPARELEGKEAKSIGVVMDGEGAALFVVGGNDQPVLSQGAGSVTSRNPKSDPHKQLPTSRFGLDEEDVSDDTTTRVADPVANAAWAAASHERNDNWTSSDQIPIDEDEAHDRDGDFDVGLTPPPPVRPMAPPPPRRPTLPPPPPESPFDEFPPTPAPLTLATLPLPPPGPSPFGQGSFERAGARVRLRHAAADARADGRRPAAVVRSGASAGQARVAASGRLPGAHLQQQHESAHAARAPRAGCVRSAASVSPRPSTFAAVPSRWSSVVRDLRGC